MGTNQSLKGKRVLVTGGTKGIGRATAIALAAEGARVLIFGREKQALQDALKDIEGEAYGLTADHGNKEDIERIFKEVDSKLGGLDILINNAAVSGKTVAEQGFDEIEDILNSNLLGYLVSAHYAIKRLQKEGEGDIVNIGSISALERGAGSDVYVATKSAIDGFSYSLREELKESGIRVILIEPGLVGTDMTLRNYSLKKQKEMADEHKMLIAEDIAECVLFALTRSRRCAVYHMRVEPRLADK